jgi:coenzyme PQQ synthesis protein D (PqqD)
MYFDEPSPEQDMTDLKLRGQDVSWTDVDGEIVALDETAAVYLGANQSGGILWRALAQGTTRESLAAALAREYGISAERAAADTDAFLASLRKRGLIES